VLSAGRGRPARTPFGLLVRLLPVGVAATKGDASRLSIFGGRICWRVGGTRDSPVEALFPQGRERFELGSSGWSWVLGTDAVGGPPGGAGVTPLWCPGWQAVTLAAVVLDLVGEVGDQLGSLCQVVAPDGMVLERFWNVREPGERT
jgi:hypothetical protein